MAATARIHHLVAGHHERMVGAFCQAVVDAAQLEWGSLLLEVGTGSGRSTLPLAEKLSSIGARLIGMDQSYSKLRQLVSNGSGEQQAVLQGDALQIPFPDHCLDAIITVHVMHLVNDRQRAFEEFRRLLRPGGIYMRGVTERPDMDSVWARLRHIWQSVLERQGLVQSHGARDDQSASNILNKMGATGRRITVVERMVTTNPGLEMNKIAMRVQGGTWQAPPEQLSELMAELLKLSISAYGSLDQEMQYRERVILEVWHFPESIYG